MTTDVYNRSTFVRNDIQDPPVGYADDSANALIRFMGSFWKNVHEGGAFIRGVQKVRGIKLAQFYLNILEILKLQDRRGLPVFHRELWKPLVIRKSKANSANANILSVGNEIVLGGQQPGSKYGEGTVLSIGGKGSFENYVAYPVEESIVSIVTGIANNVINPTVFHKVSDAFPAEGVSYVNGTLIFPKDKDPFLPESGFDVYDIPDMVDDGEGNMTPDAETVVWASDVLTDKNYVSDHMAYAIGVDCPSTELVKRIVNSGWDALNCGMTPEILRSLLAAMANVPVIQDAEETVVRIGEVEGDYRKVVTSGHAYSVYKNAVLRDAVKVGAVLRKGDFLDESVKVYPLLSDPSPEKLSGTTEYADIIEQDIPVISVPKSIIRTNTANGLAVDWNPTDVIDTLETYGEGRHRKLYFDIGGSESDVMAFWEDVWKHAEKDDIDLEDLFLDCSFDASSGSSSDPVWKIVPAKFFLKYMIGGNTLIVTLDSAQLADASNLRDPMFFDLLTSALPSGMRLFIVEHVRKDDDGDTYSLDVDTVEDDAFDFAAEDVDEDEYDYSDLPGMRGKRLPTYEDQLEMKMFRNRRRSAE